ncbi:eCIS core domain-containing protein [Paludibacterium paludis]|uniref:eCIS core domain-containing protein n=1 Tax=Paludibacterium paludis TaxID=1225769 RepID=A0A918U9K3_9NEIS|nr:DUF4157 domain-containing protein [Paludibacterium paludis]GGY13765.1 hypothetical protein GCM10011289_16390 [Paludibacterium paludis]
MKAHADSPRILADSTADTPLRSQGGISVTPHHIVDGSRRVLAAKTVQMAADRSAQAARAARYQAMADTRLAARSLSAPAPSGAQGLPDRLKSGIEHLAGLPMDDVRVHRNSALPAQLHAHAFTQGTDIHLGAGQDRHLAHEAWHVVQQKQGRVKPTIQLHGGVAINDEKELENEADRMGERAQRGVPAPMPAAPGGAPAVHAVGAVVQHKRLAGQPAENIIQCATKTSLYGTFETEAYAIKDGAEGDEVDFNLTFLPKDSADATKVALVQVVKSVYKGDIEASTPNNIAKQTEQGHEIDQHPTNRNPLYATEDEPADNADTLAAYATNHPSIGQHAIKRTGTWVQKARLIDEPTIADEADSSMEFETSALAIEGNDAGTYYGSVSWGWKNITGNHAELLPFNLASQGVPTANFLAAAKKWNSAKASTGFYYTKADNTRVVNGKDKLLFLLPKDTKVKYIDDTEDGCIEMRVVGGGHDGKKGYIKVGDLKDRGDGKDTVKLPVMDKAPEEVKWFVAQFARAKEYVVAAFIRLPDPRIDYMNFVSEASMRKHGWNSTGEMYRDLQRYKKAFEKYEPLEQLYGWSRLATVGMAMNGGRAAGPSEPPDYFI